MNARILKKLCKRAAPLLDQLGDTTEQFPVGGLEGYTPAWSLPKIDRKHSMGTIHIREDGRHYKTRNSLGWFTPLYGTIGCGWMTLNEESEWADRPAILQLKQAVEDRIAQYLMRARAPRLPGRLTYRYRHKFADARYKKAKTLSDIIDLAAFIVEIESEPVFVQSS